LGDVVGSLHPHERVHLHTKGFLNAERHIAGKVSLPVEQAGQSGLGNCYSVSCSCPKVTIMRACA
jgi:hypothetical protein